MRGGKREGAGRPAGARNKRTRAVEAAMEVVREKFEAAVPAAFEGDGVAFLQVVYRDPANPIEVRIDAASKAAAYERPRLAASIVKGDLAVELSTIPPTDRPRRIAELLALRTMDGIQDALDA